MGWSSGPPRMVEGETELEEGEAAFDDDDRRIDIERDLSYIGEKVQSVLGHFQKEFVGEVSAANLGAKHGEGGSFLLTLPGAKYGAYGSFLPMYQRSPSIWSQPSPQRFQTQSITRSPMFLRREGVAQNATALPDVPSFRRNGTAGTGGLLMSQDNMVPSGNGSVRQESLLASAQVAVAEKFPKRHQPPTNKSVIQNDKKPLKFRIKVGSDKALQKNAAIYSGLGLTSPSSSTGNSLGESEGNLLGSRETLDGSLSSIVQMLTSVIVTGGLLISPLHDNFNNFTNTVSKESKHRATVKVKPSHSATAAYDSTSQLRNEDVLPRKKTVVRKSGMHKESNDGNGKAFEDDKQSRLDNSSGAQMLQNKLLSFDGTEKHMSVSIANMGESSRDSAKAFETYRENDDGALSSKREVSKATMKDRLLGNELVKDEFLDSTSGQSNNKFEHREAKNSPLQLRKKKQRISSQKDIPVDHNEGARDKVNLNPDTDISEDERDCKGDNYLIEKPRMVAASKERDELAKSDAAKKLSLESKKNSKGARVKGKVSSDSAQERRAGVSVTVKEEGMKRDSYNVSDSQRDLVETNSEFRHKGVAMLEARVGDRLKESNCDTVKEKNAHDRLKYKPTSKKFDNQVTPGLKDPPSGSLPSNAGPALGGEQPTVAPFLIEEHWVCCDSCQKWRLLPYGTMPEHLPENWLCRMLNWLPGMNHCDISEEETTKALQALNQLPLPDNQPAFQIHGDKSAIGMPPVDQHLVNQRNQNFSFDYVDNGRKKTNKTKDKAAPVREAKNFQQDVVKRGSSKDRKQLLVGSNPSNNLSSQHRCKPEIAVEEHSGRPKQERVTGGDAKPKKKVKREPDQNNFEMQKRIKTEGAFDIDNFQTSTPNHGRVGVSLNSTSTTMTSMKNNQKHSENDYLQDLKGDERNGLQNFARKSREDSSGLLDSESLGVVRKVNDNEVPAKKRKLKDWQNYDGSELCDRNVAMEESSDSGFMRGKKLRVSQADGIDFGRIQSATELKRNDMKTRTPPLASKNPTSGNFDNPKRQNKYIVKFTSQLTREDLESLKKDMGCDPVSTAATSSSSKVSDSRKTRSSYQEMRGSPVESVSSSPIRTSIMNKLSPKSDVLGFDDSKVGDFSANGKPRKSVAGDVNHVSKRPSMAKNRKNSAQLQPESADNPVLNLLETGPWVRGESKVVGKPSTLCGNTLDKNLDLWDRHSPYNTDMRASEACKDVIGKNLQNHQRSWKDSSSPKDKEGSHVLTSGGGLETTSDPPNDQGVLNSKRSSRVATEAIQNRVTSHSASTTDAKQSFLDQSGIKSSKAHKNVTKRESKKMLDGSREHMQPVEKQRSGLELSDPCNEDANVDFGAQVAKNISFRENYGNGKSRVSREDEHKVLSSAGKSASGTPNGILMHVQAYDASAFNDVSKLSKGLGHAINQNEPFQIIDNSAADQPVLRGGSGPNPLRKDASGQTIPLVLKEAEDLRGYADQLKVFGFDFECNETLFQAALKFLHGASLLECNAETSKSGELNPLQIYISTAKLCESCAHEYERTQEMAVAALVYKCMEVAYMRVIYCKSSSANKYWHDLQASLQNAPPGESPSSSASDLDNLNNQAVVEKPPLSKSNGSHSGGHIIAPHNRPNFVRLLDFTKDVNSAMEAVKKSHDAFASANLILEEVQNKEGIIAVKRVIDFGFQDVEEFVRLVRIAVESISRRKGFGGSRH